MMKRKPKGPGHDRKRDGDHDLIHRKRPLPGLRPALPGFALLILTLHLCSCDGPMENPSTYNVLLVTLDTTRLDHLGCYGAPNNPTPHLDALAAEGVRFNLAISPSAATPISHASILTGLNPYQHGVRVIYAGGGYELPDYVPTLGSLLQERGWNTGAFLSAFTVSEFYGFDRGFDTFDSGTKAVSARSMSKTPDGFWDWSWRTSQRRADETTREACRWIGRKSEPFLAWVHYWDPHDTAILPPGDFCQRHVSPDLKGEDRVRALYRAEVAYLDTQIGELFACLRESGRFENTIVVVVADHGEGLGDHGWWFHRILYQEQIRVPLILRIPGWPREKVIDDLVRTTDILPTLLEHLGLAVPEDLAGRSLRGLVHGEAEEPRIAYADQINLFDLNARMVEARPEDGLLYCAMDRSWKLICRPNVPGRDELYNLEEDPREQNNLIEIEANEAARLMGELERFDGFVTRPFGDALDPEVLGRLRSLGYVGD